MARRHFKQETLLIIHRRVNDGIDDILRDPDPWALHRDKAVQSWVRSRCFFCPPIPSAPKLRLDDEIREINNKLRAADYRDAFDFVPRFAARPDDLIQALLEHKPQIVHFSGHGSRAQAPLRRRSGERKPVTKEALVHLFRALKGNIRLVLLNACSTRPQAEAVAETIDCTIGMREPIGDEAAIVFAASFYRALGFGRSVRKAFEVGKATSCWRASPKQDARTADSSGRRCLGDSVRPAVGTRSRETRFKQIRQPSEHAQAALPSCETWAGWPPRTGLPS